VWTVNKMPGVKTLWKVWTAYQMQELIYNEEPAKLSL
jgi:hypothetical protein